MMERDSGRKMDEERKASDKERATKLSSHKICVSQICEGSIELISIKKSYTQHSIG